MSKRVIAAAALLLFTATVGMSLAAFLGCHDAGHGVAGLVAGESCSLLGPVTHLTTWQTVFFSFVLGSVFVAAVVLAAIALTADASTDPSKRLERFRQYRHTLAIRSMTVFDPLLEFFRSGRIENRRSANALA